MIIAPLDIMSDITLALVMIFFVMIINWARSNIGSTKLAILFAAIVAYLTIFKHPELAWLALILILAGTGIFNSFIKGLKG